MIEPHVRSASADDWQALRELQRCSRHALASVRGGNRWLQTHSPFTIADISGDPATTLGVTTIDDVVVGYILLRLGEVSTVADIYVHHMAREVGCGDALLDWGMHEARAFGAQTFEGHALPGDRDMKNLFERGGVTARLITVSVEL